MRKKKRNWHAILPLTGCGGDTEFGMENPFLALKEVCEFLDHFCLPLYQNGFCTKIGVEMNVYGGLNDVVEMMLKMG